MPDHLPDWRQIKDELNEFVIYLMYFLFFLKKNVVNKNSVILASDTVVEVSGRILEKPKDKNDAFSMLTHLSGKTHRVYTGVCIIDAGSQREMGFYEKCIVHMAHMSSEQIHEYIETGQPMDKAGSYGIQGPGALFISGIEGDFFTVCGLPVSKVYRSLLEFGISPIMGNAEYL